MTSTTFDWAAAVEEIGGRIIEDKTNENGRFITVAVAADSRLKVWALQKLAKPHFAHASLPSMAFDCDLDYSFSVYTECPSLLLPGCIYPAGSFGQMTHVEVQTRMPDDEE